MGNTVGYKGLFLLFVAGIILGGALMWLNNSLKEPPKCPTCQQCPHYTIQTYGSEIQLNNLCYYSMGLVDGSGVKDSTFANETDRICNYIEMRKKSLPFIKNNGD